MQISKQIKCLSLLKSVSVYPIKLLLQIFIIPKSIHIENYLSLNQCTFALRHKNTPIFKNRHTLISQTYFTMNVPYYI